jgi:hypothetical protein
MEVRRSNIVATCHTLLPAGSASTRWRERLQEKQSRDQQTILCGVIPTQGDLVTRQAEAVRRRVPFD